MDVRTLTEQKHPCIDQVSESTGNEKNKSVSTSNGPDQGRVAKIRVKHLGCEGIVAGYRSILA